MVEKGCLTRFVKHVVVSAFSIDKIAKSLTLSSMGEGDTFTNGNFLYKCKFPLQKEDLFLVFKAVPESVSSK